MRGGDDDMSSIAREIVDIVDMLPEEEQYFAYEFVKRLMLAWDPDYTKATPSEAADMKEALAEYDCGETVRLEDIEDIIGGAT